MNRRGSTVAGRTVRPGGRTKDKAGEGDIAGTAEEQRRFGAVLNRKQITSLYQPIVGLHTGAVVAYEALARGPKNTPLETPDTLFAAARRYGRLAELEWQCRAAALQGALDAELGNQTSLFINVEPSIVGNIMPPDVDRLFRSAERKLRLVLEITERDLCRRPAELLAFVQWARERWWGIALDDVGAEPESLALLPFLEPDVIKLDMKIIHEPETPETAALMEAVHAEANRTGAAVLAEGIENEEHLERAHQLGVSLVQGWYFGRPAPLAPTPPNRHVVRLRSQVEAPRDTPFDLLLSSAPTVEMPFAELLELAAGIEQEALGIEDPVVIASFGTTELFTADIAARYEQLASHAVFVGALAAELPREAAKGVRSTPLPQHDALTTQYVVTLVAASGSAGIAARLPKRPPAPTDVVPVTFSRDPDAVLKAARQLMGKVLPAYR